MPKSLGSSMTLHVYVDSDHAGDLGHSTFSNGIRCIPKWRTNLLELKETDEVNLLR